jgi:hypothetical protein
VFYTADFPYDVDPRNVGLTEFVKYMSKGNRADNGILAEVKYVGSSVVSIREIYIP